MVDENNLKGTIQIGRYYYQCQSSWTALDFKVRISRRAREQAAKD